MFGLIRKKKYDELKKDYIELVQSTVRKLESGYLYLVGIPGADRETLQAIAGMISVALKENRITRTKVLCIGTDITIQVPETKPSGLSEIPVPKPPRRKKQ